MSRKRTRKRKPAQAAGAAASKPAKAAGQKAAGQPRVAKRETAPLSGPIVAMLALAGAGILLTAYLTAIKLFGAPALACGVGSGCDLVQTSRWSMLLGVPISLWGLLTYVVIAACVWRARRVRRAWGQAFAVAAIGFAISVYLTIVSVIEIEATCPYCLASLGLMTALLVGLTVLRPTPSGEPRLASWAPGSAIAAVAIAAGLHAHYSGIFDPSAGPERPELVALTEHLTETGARFYGAYWCGHCQEQKRLFEASVKRLPYVECTPDGRGGPRAVACVTKNINAYPTWIIEGRRYEQVLEPAELARLSGMEWPPDRLAAAD